MRRVKFVKDVEALLQQREYVPTENLPNALAWRRSRPWLLVKFGLRVEIRAAHELRFMPKDGHSKVGTAKNSAEAIEIIDARELEAEFD
jgi:hypothetical protein